MDMIYNVIDNGADEVINYWFPSFCAGISSLNWQNFYDKMLIKIYKLASFGRASALRNAAAEIINAAIIAADNKTLEGNLLHTYLELCQDTDNVVCKTAIGNLKQIFMHVDPLKIEKLFFAEVLI